MFVEYGIYTDYAIITNLGIDGNSIEKYLFLYVGLVPVHCWQRRHILDAGVEM